MIYTFKVANDKEYNNVHVLYCNSIYEITWYHVNSNLYYILNENLDDPVWVGI